MSTCFICCETVQAEKLVPCLCTFTTCSACVIRYILESSQDPHCMKCKVGWNTEFLVNHLGKDFVYGTYKIHRQNLLFEREKARLPETMAKIVRDEEEKQARELLLVQLRALKDGVSKQLVQARSLRQLRERDLAEQLSLENIKALVDADALLQFLPSQVYSYGRFISRLERGADILLEKKAKAKFIRACPATGCRGLLSENWTCAICQKKTCSKCHELKDDEHECILSNLETAQLLKQDTRACPGCGALIHRLSGCDQMFCTQCGTPFSWRTGEKTTGVIHNPHFYEYQRNRTTAAPAPVDPCQPYQGDVQLVANTIGSKLKGSNKQLYEILMAAHRGYRHNSAEVLPKYDITAPNNQDLRIDFLKNRVTELKFKDALQRRDKDYHKRRDYHGILVTYQRAQADILMRLERMLHTEEWKVYDLVAVVAIELTTLKEEFNNWLSKTAQYYNCLAPYIHSDFLIYSSMGVAQRVTGQPAKAPKKKAAVRK